MSTGSTLITPLGPLTLWEEAGAIIALTWDNKSQQSATFLLHAATTQIREYFAGERQRFDLPLNPYGTDFQRSVWRIIEGIPYGWTRRYGDIADHLKTAPRAVGRACSANPIPILIPCHRVVGKGSVLGGYSCGNGISSKRCLLKLERTTARRRTGDPELM